jgi:predicted nucleic acid-binding protein
VTALVDSCVWSLALRRTTTTAPEVRHLETLINRDEAAIIGPVRQEILCGIRTSTHFVAVRNRLRAFSDLRTAEIHFERAAEFYNECRSKGLQGSNVDFLICAVADLYDVPIFTTDRDFQNYAKHLPIRLYSP